MDSSADFFSRIDDILRRVFTVSEARVSPGSFQFAQTRQLQHPMKIITASLFSILVIASQAAEKPKLQIINGSDTNCEVFWLKSDSERISNGSIEPGEDRIITTTIGHRFEITSGENKTSITVASEVPVQAVRFDPKGGDGIPAFYTQRVKANGFPIVASAKVNPYALKEASFLVDMMLAKRPDVRQAMIQSGARMCVMAHNEYTTDLPEFTRMAEHKVHECPHIHPKDYWDARARGLGGSETDPLCTVAEENVLAFEGDPYEEENILIHEFAHNIHLRGMLNVDPTFDKRLKATYDAAMKAGLWKGKYAAVNHYEYFAEGVQSWFDDNRVNDHDHNHVHLRSQLIEYDSGLAAMCREVFGDTELKYTKPTTRLIGHMAGYDPAKSPTFVWPERLQKAKAAIREKAVARDKTANSDGTREIRNVSGWSIHIRRELLTDEAPATAKALELIQAQLEEIIRVVPKAAVVELKKVPLYFSPEYPGIRPSAEYHPGAGWLKDNGRDPAMAKGVEFTNIRVFEADTRRMPNFALHELAHAYHDRFLPGSHENAEIKAAYQAAKAAGGYERVERTDAEGNKHMDRAYAMTNPAEYFAETTEAYFSRNDFFPYTNDQLRKHDPRMHELLGKLWGANGPATAAPDGE
jgi:Mlc titration factor MtfA (ptsG expression regulator)